MSGTVHHGIMLETLKEIKEILVKPELKETQVLKAIQVMHSHLKISHQNNWPV